MQRENGLKCEVPNSRVDNPEARPLISLRRTEETLTITYLCLKLEASLFSSAIALSAARALSCWRKQDPDQCVATHQIKERKNKSYPVVVSFLLMSSDLKKTTHQQIRSGTRCDRRYDSPLDTTDFCSCRAVQELPGF